MLVLSAMLLALQAAPETDPHAEWEAQEARRQQEDEEARAAFAAIQGYAEVGCNDLYYCLDLFDRTHRASIRQERLEFFSPFLRRHGERARTVFLDRLESENRGLREDARDILIDWGNWNASHAARLRGVIQENSTREAFQVLGSIASPEIIQDLFAALEANEEDWNALAGLRYAAERNPEAIRMRLANFIREDNDLLTWRTTNLFRDANLEEAQIETFARDGANPALPMAEREASLRILMGIGERAGPAEYIMVDFRHRAESGLRRVVDNILMYLGNGTFVAEIAERCMIYESEFDPLYSLSDDCPHRYLSDLGEAGSGAGPALLRLLDSPHPDQRVDALHTLGRIAYRDAIPQIIPFLVSENWREVRQAIEALKVMRARDATPVLDGLAESHWLPDVRREAARAIEIITNTGIPEGEADDDWIGSWGGLDPPNCSTGRWVWQGIPVPEARYQWEEQQGLHGEIGAEIPTGHFTGTNRGEWGGELTWYPNAGYEVELVPENVLAILPYEEGILAAVGLAHLFSDRGEILRVEISSSGKPVIHRVAELPEAPYGGISHVGGRTYAAFGTGYDDEPHRHFVTVFDAEAGILGLADCAD